MKKFLDIAAKFLKDLLLFVIGFGIGLICGVFINIL